MRSKTALMAGLLLAAPFAHASDDLVPKQLAGPPSEFAAMRAPSPAAAAIVSRSAVLPVELTAGKSGRLGWQARIPVESGALRFALLSGGDRGWRVSLVAPDGARHGADALSKAMHASSFGLGGDQHPADVYALDDLPKGQWELAIDAPSASGRRGLLVLEGDASTELASWPAHTRHLAGSVQQIVATLGGGVDAVELGAAAGTVEHVTLRVTAPSGAMVEYAMHDDGAHGDGAAGDGVYGAGFLADVAGAWSAQVVVEGRSAAGAPLLRTAEHIVPVVERSLALRGTRAQGKALPGGRLAIELAVDAAKAGQHYRAWAEVWGTGADGAALPVAWIGGMATPAAGRIALGLDERWIALAGARAPFELRNLRLEDPSAWVTVAGAQRLPLALPAIRTKLAAADIEVDEAMAMGPRPVASEAKAVGGKLMLVHGYCSGGVWPAAQFASAITFADNNQNRSHDTFARLIANFGASWPSFGVVAHSQGGAASLHLYTYYWSGLDNATPTTARLIQSVGTPYQGTNLAGILATLGSWFGVGCGTNSDLSYGGASAWLAGIPSWARAKVNYYTTSFRSTNWWTNDYCNFATDLVLSDPEDGTTEQANGQLPGALNRGHVSGQCHTTGMRDPAQYLDASRNATMNANAAR